MPAKKAKNTPGEVAVETRGDVAMLTVHRTLYPEDVLFGTAFTFLDRCFVHLDMADADHVRVELTARPGGSAADLAGAFKNELVTQAVRLRLARETEQIRTLIVGRAIGEAIPEEPGDQDEFSPELPPEVAKILAEEEDSLDFLDDPLGIAVPWEEKYGKDGKVPAAPEAAPDAVKPE